MKAMALVFFILFAAPGCQRSVTSIHFVLPEGFSGSFVVLPNKADGAEPIQRDGELVLEIPANGVLRVKSDPFSSYRATASFRSGRDIWVKRNIKDKPPPDTAGLWDLPTRILHEARAVEHWWHVGTEEQWNSLRPEQRYKPGRATAER